MPKRLLDCCASDFRSFTKSDLLESIQKSEGRVIACETIGTVQPLLGNVTNAEFAASMGADILLLNMFDVQHPVINGLPETEPENTVRMLKKLTGRPIGINLEPVAEGEEGETDPIWKMSAGRRATVENATVPVIETGAGNCHVYIDRAADLEKAVAIADNAKTSRPSVCNAVECVLIHEAVAAEFLQKAVPLLDRKHVELRCDEASLKLLGARARAAEDADWDAEYDDYILAVHVVRDLDEAMEFIAAHSTQHSECIVTESYAKAQRFLDEVDAAAVYVNASTRFTDGGEFGMGAEIGISTQKMHARGPMGLEELTSYKYIVYGNGQVR